MAVLLLIAGGLGFLVVGIILNSATLLWITLLICLVGLILITGDFLVRRRRHSPDRQEDSGRHAEPEENNGADPLGDLRRQERAVPHDRLEEPAAPAAGTMMKTDGAVASGLDGRQPGALAVEDEAGIRPAGPLDATLDAESVVHVIPRRKRYHRPGCRLLAGHTSEELMLEEALEEGFTACSVCTSEPGDS